MDLTVERYRSLIADLIRDPVVYGSECETWPSTKRSILPQLAKLGMDVWCSRRSRCHWLTWSVRPSRNSWI